MVGERQRFDKGRERNMRKLWRLRAGGRRGERGECWRERRAACRWGLIEGWSGVQLDRRGDEREMGGAGRRGRLAYSIVGLISFPLKAPERADMD